MPTTPHKTLTNLGAALEICQYDRQNLRSIIHVPCSALLYVGAIDLQVEAMKHHLVRVLQHTAKDLARYLKTNFMNQAMDDTEVVTTVFHLKNALEVAYSHPSQAETLPLRLAVANILDTLFPFLIRHPVFLDLLSADFWKRYSVAISTDLMDVRFVREEGCENTLETLSGCV